MIKDPMQWDSEWNEFETKPAVRGTNATRVMNLSILLILKKNVASFVSILFLFNQDDWIVKVDSSATRYNKNIEKFEFDLIYDVGRQKDEDELNH